MSQFNQATIKRPGTTSLRADGPCLVGTMAALGTGPDAMSPGALEKVKSDALDLLATVVSHYAHKVAPGEVGADGSAIASLSPASHCTGLLYGRIQSGKTVAMIGLVAAAMDNGFRVFVVLTSDNVKLVSQTTERFQALDGPLPIDARASEWKTDQEHIGKHISKTGVVFVCSKNKQRLDDLVDFLGKIGAPDYPALILDDEADQATPDANLARRVNARKKGSSEVIAPTAINANVEVLRATLRHHVFLQVTATPYALLLQRSGTSLRPAFTHLLEPGEAYTGGDAFFDDELVEGPSPPLVYVDPKESEALNAGAAPDGLQKAIAFFLVAAAAQALIAPEHARIGQNFLCHTSQLRSKHSELKDLVVGFVNRASDQLESCHGDAYNRVEVAYDDLKATMQELPPLDEVLQVLRRRIPKRKVLVVNAETDASIGSGMNLVIGGNILGRGVTIKNLLVTYYMREPKVGQMDTMLQHARMYGYRRQLMPLTRVFLPEVLAMRFHEIHKIERRLRAYLKGADPSKPVPLERSVSLQPTRRGVLDPDYLDSFAAGDQVYASFIDVAKAADYERVHKEVARLCGGVLPAHAPGECVDISLAQLIDLVQLTPPEFGSGWYPEVIATVLKAQESRLSGRAFLHTRRISRKNHRFATAALDGESLALLRKKDGPVLCLFRDDGKYLGRPFWYPTVIMDKGMSPTLVNVSSDDA